VKAFGRWAEEAWKCGQSRSFSFVLHHLLELQDELHSLSVDLGCWTHELTRRKEMQAVIASMYQRTLDAAEEPSCLPSSEVEILLMAARAARSPPSDVV